MTNTFRTAWSPRSKAGFVFASRSELRGTFRAAPGYFILKKVAIGIVAALLLVSVIGYFWVRSLFAQDAVRLALASQISSAIGQPVSIESIGASIYPRVTVKLGGVSIGHPARIRVRTLRLGTDFRALLSRQIVGGTVHLDGARLELPLPAFGAATTSTPAPSNSGSPLEIVSVDEIVLNDVEIVSGGRTLRGDIFAVPRGAGATLPKISLSAEDTHLTGTGEIKNLAGPVGEIAIRAQALNFTRLIDFLTTFSGGSGLTSTTPAVPAAKAPPTDLTLSLTADRATMGTMALDTLSGRARVTQQAVTFDALQFGVFGGRYKGTMTLTADASSTFRLHADVSNIDVAAVTAFAGTSGVISRTTVRTSRDRRPKLRRVPRHEERAWHGTHRHQGRRGEEARTREDDRHRHVHAG